MKKILFIALTILLLVACSEESTNDLGVEEEDVQEEDSQEQKASEDEEEIEEGNVMSEDEITNIITEKVDSEYNSTSIREIRIDVDSSTGEGYFVVINLTIDSKSSAGTVKDMIETNSSDLATTLAEIEDINSVVSFWEVPNLQESRFIAKISTKHSGDEMEYIEKWYDQNIFN